MFLKLTEYDRADPVYINTNEIRKFYKFHGVSKNTVANTCIDLQYGTMLVKERPEEIMEMMEVKHEI